MVRGLCATRNVSFDNAKAGSMRVLEPLSRFCASAPFNAVHETMEKMPGRDEARPGRSQDGTKLGRDDAEIGK